MTENHQQGPDWLDALLAEVAQRFTAPRPMNFWVHVGRERLRLHRPMDLEPGVQRASLQTGRKVRARWAGPLRARWVGNRVSIVIGAPIPGKATVPVVCSRRMEFSLLVEDAARALASLPAAT